MSIEIAMREACAALRIEAPRTVRAGEWVKTRALDSKSPSNTSGRVFVSDDGRSGCAWNWKLGGAHQRFWEGGSSNAPAPAPMRDPEAEARKAAERRDVLEACRRIVSACDQAVHPYLDRKGFRDEIGLAIEDPRPHLPTNRLGEAMASAIPVSDKPLLVIPGWIDNRIETLQFITADGDKKNLLRGQMGGAAHRIATGRETWVCEGIATALTVRAALRRLGRSATVLSAFSASNVGKVATGIPNARIAADHDRPLEQLHGKGTGEFYAVQSGRSWVMPPELGDFNDMHRAKGLREVAMLLRGAMR